MTLETDVSSLLHDHDDVLTQKNLLPIKCTEVVVIGSSLDTAHNGPLRRFIEDLEQHQEAISIHVHKVSTEKEFESLLERYAAKACNGACPLIHIGMHGGEVCGLCIGGDQYIKWPRLCELLSAINRHTQNRMMVMLFSCLVV